MFDNDEIFNEGFNAGYEQCAKEAKDSNSASMGGCATINKNDMDMATLLEQMLKNSPYPTSDTRWQSIEKWAEGIRKRVS